MRNMFHFSAGSKGVFLMHFDVICWGNVDLSLGAGTGHFRLWSWTLPK